MVTLGITQDHVAGQTAGLSARWTRPGQARGIPAQHRGDEADKVTAALFGSHDFTGGFHRQPADLDILPADLDILVEVKGLEPSASTLRMYGSQPFDQALSGDFPGGGVSIPSGSLTIPPLPAG